MSDASSSGGLQLQDGASVTIDLDGCMLSITNPGAGLAAINVPGGASLTVEDTSSTVVADQGTLIATGGPDNNGDGAGAGIGGDDQGQQAGSVTITAGNINATGGASSDSAGGAGAGIGGGGASSSNGTGGASGTTTISGGSITATGGASSSSYGGAGAGIGGGGGGEARNNSTGGASGTITVSGGSITATGGASSGSNGGAGAGIGGGGGGSAGNSTGGASGTTMISGGSITATGGASSSNSSGGAGAGIGGGGGGGGGVVISTGGNSGTTMISGGSTSTVAGSSSGGSGSGAGIGGGGSSNSFNRSGGVAASPPVTVAGGVSVTGGTPLNASGPNGQGVSDGTYVENNPTVTITTSASQTTWYASVSSIPAVTVSGTVGGSGFGSLSCSGDGIMPQSFASAAGGTVDLTGLDQGQGQITCKITSNSGLTQSASITLRLDSMTPTLTLSGPSQTISYASVSSIPALKVSGTVGPSGLGSLSCSGDGIGPQSFTSVAGGTVDLTGLDQGQGQITCTITSNSGLTASASITLRLAQPPVTSVLRIAGISVSSGTVRWCFDGCGLPGAQLRFTLNHPSVVRLLLVARVHGRLMVVSRVYLSAHAGRVSYRIAGRWHGQLLIPRAVLLLVQTQTAGRWQTHATFRLRVINPDRHTYATLLATGAAVRAG